jgi:uncharacterized membrane protein YagU involved in acid resistance
MNKPYLKAAIYSGLIAGLVFLILEMILVPVFMNGSPWAPPRMIAAIILGKDVLPMPGQPVTFDFGVIMVAMMLHFLLSVVYAFVIGWVCKSLSMSSSILLGAVFGLILYFVNFYGLTAIFPWFEMARNWVSIFSHLMFGVIAAYTFKKIYYPVTIHT